jgi:branched-chain amino acid transport system substrate-binding protein
MRIRNLLMIALALLLVGSFAFARGGAEGDVIKIGVGGVHSGDLASYGLPTVNAAELVVAKVNAAGGVLGKQIVLVIEDDVCAPDIASSTATKLVSEGVVAVIGHICSGATATALPIYQESRIVAISPSATNPSLAEFPNFFRTIAPDDAQGQLQADFLVDVLGVSKVAVLHDKEDYGKGLAEFAREYLEAAGVEVVLFEGITTGAVDFSAIINRVRAAGVDAVVFGGYHPDASKLVDQGRQAGLLLPFISGDGVKDDTFINVAGSAAEGVYATGPRDTSSNPMDAMAKQEHIDKYGTEPGPFFMNGYAATLAIINAIEKAGSTDYDAIVAALTSNYVDTPLGSISFASDGNAIGVGFAVYQVQNMEYVQLGD